MPNDTITPSDLDFYLTVIALFCAYNQSQHFSDKMFADITSDIIKRDAILERLAADGYITATKSKNFPHRYTIDITAKGKRFQQAGGYGKQEKNENAKQIKYSSRKFARDIIIALVGAAIQFLFTSLTG